MKVLSLLQPWASLVVCGAKKIETRSWTTAYRGPLFIHASLGRAGALVAAEAPFTQHIPDFKALPFGAIIGQVMLTGVLRTEALGLPDAAMGILTLEEKIFGDYSAGRYAWILEEPAAFDDPIPAKGKLGLWEI
jgi:hypothetical protein